MSDRRMAGLGLQTEQSHRESVTDRPHNQASHLPLLEPYDSSMRYGSCFFTDSCLPSAIAPIGLPAGMNGLNGACIYCILTVIHTCIAAHLPRTPSINQSELERVRLFGGTNDASSASHRIARKNNASHWRLVVAFGFAFFSLSTLVALRLSPPCLVNLGSLSSSSDRSGLPMMPVACGGGPR